jgi:hypothetical protein
LGGDLTQFYGLSSKGKLIIGSIEGKTLLFRSIKHNEDVNSQSLAPGVYCAL